MGRWSFFSTYALLGGESLGATELKRLGVGCCRDEVLISDKNPEECDCYDTTKLFLIFFALVMLLFYTYPHRLPDY